MTHSPHEEQGFKILEQRYGTVPMVDVVTWFGDGNRAGLSVYNQNLRDLRDTINDYLGDTCDCDWDD